MEAPVDHADLVLRADRAVSSITDPELKKIAFEGVLADLRADRSANLLERLSKLIQVLSVVAGVILSVLSFNHARNNESEARKAEANAKELELQKREAEAAKPFLELRQRIYLEAVQAAAVLSTPKEHSEEDLKKAKTRFHELYVAELSLVEGVGVEAAMIGLAELVAPELKTLTPDQSKAYGLAHALRDSLVQSWHIDETIVDNPNR